MCGPFFFFSLSGWTGMVLATLRYSGTRRLIGMEAGSPPPLTDYSYRLVRFHEAIICLHTPPALGMAHYRNARCTLAAMAGNVCRPGRVA